MSVNEEDEEKSVGEGDKCNITYFFYIIWTLLHGNYIINLNINIHIFIIYFKIYFST